MATRQTNVGSAQHFNGATEQSGQGVMGQVRSATHAVQSQAEHVVADYPLSTVLTVFGIGIGVGVALGTVMFSSSSSSSYSSHWLPSSSSSWLPGSSQASWFGNHGSNWFGNNPSNWSDSLVKGAKNMCGY